MIYTDLDEKIENHLFPWYGDADFMHANQWKGINHWKR